MADGRFNVLALAHPQPAVVLSTHIDCVPPFFPSRVEAGTLFGRGACDAKGALAAQVVAAERLRRAGEERLGLLFVVGEERGSDGAIRANELAPPGVRFLLNGEPTSSRLGRATRGVLRVKLAGERPRGALLAAVTGRERDRQADRRARRAAAAAAARGPRARADLLFRRPGVAAASRPT